MPASPYSKKRGEGLQMSSDRQLGGGEVVIQASGVGKCYHIYERPSHRLLQGIVGRSRKFYEEFWAVRGVDLSVRRGETLGIIGRNGSGKSTLLQLIAGTLAPTEGEISVGGRTAALLELGSGFNPEFSGRENVYLNASILGLTKADIDKRLQKILEFADIGAFVDQPVRNYSSGMVMRLAFSVMAHVDADILIIDEALSVGDAFFTQKCMRFLRDFQSRGTLLFVSHDAGAVTGLCDRAVWIDGGAVRASGPAKQVMSAYLEAYIAEREGRAGETVRGRGATASAQVPRVQRDTRQALIDRSTLRNDIHVPMFDPNAAGFGEMGARIVEVVLLDEEGRRLPSIAGGELVSLEIVVHAERALASPIVGFYVKDRLGQMLFGDNTYLSCLERATAVAAGQLLRARFQFVMPRLQAGDYFLTAGIAEGTQEDHLIQHWMHEALMLRSLGSPAPAGIIGIPMHSITLESLP
jgi:lipopolysaccharide transport system ATP-binding protein